MLVLNSTFDFYKKHSPNFITKDNVNILEASGFDAEYYAIRNHIGLTDFSSFSKFKIIGETAELYLDNFVSGKILGMTENTILKTLILDDSGKVFSFITLFKAFDYYLIIANSKHRNSLKNLFNESIKDQDIVIEDITNKFSILALEGPKSTEYVEEILSSEVFGMTSLSFIETEFREISLIIARISATGEFGYHFLVPIEGSVSFLEFLKESVPNITLCGHNVHHLLQLESCFFDELQHVRENETALQAGLGWSINMKKDFFVGKESVLKEKQSGMTKNLVAFKCLHTDFMEKPQEKNPIFFNNKKKIGYVAYCDYSIGLKCFVGLAYLKNSFAYAGLNLTINQVNPIKTVSAPILVTQSMQITNF